jgi:PAS domain S-box-containing protein
MSLIPPFSGYLFREGAPEDPFDPVEVIRRMGNGREIRRLFDCLDDVYFFVRDHAGFYMAANTAFLRLFDFPIEEELIGRGLNEVHPPDVAADLSQEDQQVRDTGRSSIDRPERWRARGGHPVPVLTTRLPLQDRFGEFIGIMGVSRRAPNDDLEPGSQSQFERLAQEIRATPGAPYRIASLAQRCGLSQRRFNECFREAFGQGPQEFILRVRVEAAKDSLRSSELSVGQIADLYGFVDQAAFTRHFRRLTGMTPGAYRKEAKPPSAS